MYSSSQVGLFFSNRTEWYRRYVLRVPTSVGPEIQRYFDMGNVFDRLVKLKIVEHCQRVGIPCTVGDLTLEVEPSGEGKEVGERRWDQYVTDGLAELLAERVDGSDRVMLEPWLEGDGLCGKPDAIFYRGDRATLWDWKCTWGASSSYAIPRGWKIASDFYFCLVPEANVMAWERIGEDRRDILVLKPDGKSRERVDEYIAEIKKCLAEREAFEF